MSTADIEDSYPLSAMQQGMLLHGMGSAGAGSYVQHAICDIDEALDTALLERAWQHVIGRHAVMRTAFRVETLHEPLQEVVRHVEVPWTREDWSTCTRDAQEASFEAYIESDRREDFDPAQAPLMRLALFRMAEKRFKLLWTYHHALLDGRAVRIVLREVFDGYDALMNGSAASPPAPARPYRDYVAWLKARDTVAAEEFWRNNLAAHLAPTSLALPSPQRPAAAGAGYGSCETRLPKATTDALRAKAREQQLTLNTLVLGAWAQLLSRYSGETDVSFGATLSLRGLASEAFNDTIGPLINTVPLRVAVLPDVALLAWLRGLRSQWLSMRAHAWVPLTRVREWSAIPRELPLFSTVVVFEHKPLEAALKEDRREWTSRHFSRRSGASHPLTLISFGEPELSLKIVYDRLQFDHAVVGPMLEHLRTLLEGMLDNGGTALRDQRFLSELEQKRLLVDWNDTAKVFAAEDCVHRLFERQVERTPDAVAVESGGRTLTYRELNDRSNGLALELQAAGVAANSLVALCMHRTLEVVVAMMAIMKAGGALLPVDAGYPSDRIRYIIDDAGVSIVLATAASKACLEAFGGKVFVVDENRSPAPATGSANRISGVGLKDLAYAVYTSGSTGHPKGILVSHDALTNHTLMLIEKYAFSPGDRRLQFVSIASDVVVADIFPALAAGSTVVMWPHASVVSVADFVAFLDQRSISISALPSAYWHEWAAALASDSLPFPRALRVVISGMDKARADLLAIWKRKASRNARWFNVYGPSETTCSATSYEADLADDAVSASVPIGRPLANVRIRVLDAQARLVPIGVAGEICIGGRGVARGYLGQPALTSQRFVQDPFGAPGDRMYKTGDVGRYREDGNLEFLGRVDDQIKIRGFRVEPGEVEEALRRLPDVREAAVIVRGEREDARELIAYVVAAPGTELEPRDFLLLLRKSLPDYMLPSAIVMIGAMPLTPNGKIDHRALPVPGFSDRAAAPSYVQPRDPLEYTLTCIWEELLGVRVGVLDDFFDIGGHSLLAVQMLHAVSRTCGRSVPTTTLFTESTIERLAKVLRGDFAMPAAPLIALNPRGTRPPLLFLHGDFTGGGFYCEALARALGPDQPFYAIHPHGLDRSAVPESIAAMAAERVLSVREVLPHGPYALGGHCYGALVALEMARQLMRDGERVVTVIMIDARAPWRPKLIFSSDAPATGEPFGSSSAAPGASVVTRSDSVAQRYRSAVARYLPEAFPGRIAVLRSEALLDLRPSLGWSLVADRVDTHAIPGNHFSAITRHSGELSTCIRRAIDDALDSQTDALAPSES